MKNLALVLRALGIGLAVEALNQPGEVNTRLYGDSWRSSRACSTPHSAGFLRMASARLAG
jgi:hypothetical protein